MAIWHIVYSLGTFFPVLVSCTTKNLATLTVTQKARQKKVRRD
jgi:hypothetical protein